MRALVALSLAASLALLSACDWGGTQPPVQVSPTPSPTWVPPIGDTTSGRYSHSGIEVHGGGLYVQVKDAAGKAVKGARLKLYGPTLVSVETNDSGEATLGPLAVGSGYRLVVEADGYATNQQGNIEIKKSEVSAQRPNLSRGASLSGRVLAGGQPVAGAVVSDGLNSALTDASGSYTLGGVAPGPITLSASKSRFRTASRQLEVASQGATAIDLALEGAEPVAYFDGTVTSGVSPAKLSALQGYLRGRGWTLSSQPPAREGVWVLVSPSQAPSPDTIGRITNFVAQGGKLVIFGEWGGFSGFHNPGANALAHQVGLHFNPDLVRVPGASPDAPTIRNFQPGQSALSDVKTVQLYSTSSLFALAPMAALAQTGAEAFRVQANAAVGAKEVVMGGPYKAGKAIALGDTSAWLDEDSDGDGVANAEEADNLALAGAVFDW